MINTTDMYGDVQQEEDGFQIAYRKRMEAQKGMRREPDFSSCNAAAAEAAMKHEQAASDAGNDEPQKSTNNELRDKVRKFVMDEIQHREINKCAETVNAALDIPEVSEEYPYNALEVMFNMQESLQNMLGKKRGTLTPDSDENLFVKSGMSIYHFGSVVTELFELDEQITKDKYEITDLSKLELTDAFHFLMNTMLYINMKPHESLQWYYGKAKSNFNTGTVGETSLRYLIGDYVLAFGQVMQQLPYKAWKKYDSYKPKVPVTMLADMLDTVMVKFMKLYIALGMTEEDIWRFYYIKNRENFERQLTKTGRYYE